MSDQREAGELRIQEAIKAYQSDLKDDYGRHTVNIRK